MFHVELSREIVIELQPRQSNINYMCRACIHHACSPQNPNKEMTNEILNTIM